MKGEKIIEKIIKAHNCELNECQLIDRVREFNLTENEYLKCMIKFRVLNRITLCKGNKICWIYYPDTYRKLMKSSVMVTDSLEKKSRKKPEDNTWRTKVIKILDKC